jgi:hypothetical protein
MLGIALTMPSNEGKPATLKKPFKRPMGNLDYTLGLSISAMVK